MAGFKLPWSLRTIARVVWDDDYVAESSRTVTIAGGANQIRTMFNQEVLFELGGGSDQNFTLSTTLANSARATILHTFYDQSGGGVMSHTLVITSNTNILIRGSDANNLNINFTVIEFQNLDA